MYDIACVYYYTTNRKIWITCVAFGIVGIGAALSITPIYADILKIGKYVTVS
jgi:hypothetical protein